MNDEISEHKKYDNKYETLNLKKIRNWPNNGEKVVFIILFVAHHLRSSAYNANFN